MKDTGKADGNDEEEEDPEEEDVTSKTALGSSSVLTPLPSNLEELRWSDPNLSLRDLGFKISRSGKLFHVSSRKIFSWRKFLHLKPGETPVELLNQRSAPEIDFIKRKISTLLDAFRRELNRILTTRYTLHSYFLKCLDFSNNTDKFLASHDALENTLGLIVFFTANGIAGVWDKK